jgi:hypothetical protein
VKICRWLCVDKRERGQCWGCWKRKRGKGESWSLFFFKSRRWREKKKGGYGAGLSSFTAGVRRMTDWEGWLCLGEKEQENGAGLREEENAGTGLERERGRGEVA